MDYTRVSLDQIYPKWKGSVVSAYFDQLMRGIERENDRLAGMPFVAFEFVRDVDYDGLTEALQLIEGFSNETEAVEYVDWLAEASLAAEIAKSRWNSPDWRLSIRRDHLRPPDAPEYAPVRCVHQRSLQLSMEHGYDSKESRFEVLAVSEPNVVGPALFAYCDAQEEWTSFLAARGSGQPT